MRLHSSWPFAASAFLRPQSMKHLRMEIHSRYKIDKRKLATGPWVATAANPHRSRCMLPETKRQLTKQRHLFLNQETQHQVPP